MAGEASFAGGAHGPAIRSDGPASYARPPGFSITAQRPQFSVGRLVCQARVAQRPECVTAGDFFITRKAASRSGSARCAAEIVATVAPEGRDALRPSNRRVRESLLQFGGAEVRLKVESK